MHHVADHDRIAKLQEISYEQVYLNLSNDGGETFSDTVVVEKADPCECCGSRAYFATNGDLYFAYRDKAENMRDMYLMLLKHGSDAFTRKRLGVTPWKIEACPMSGTYLTGGAVSQPGRGESAENLVAGWETKGRIYFAQLSPDGRMLPPGEIKAAAFGKYPTVLGAPDGTTLVAWKSGQDLQWQVYDQSGKPQGGQASVPADSPHRPGGVVTSAGNFILFP